MTKDICLRQNIVKNKIYFFIKKIIYAYVLHK